MGGGSLGSPASSVDTLYEHRLALIVGLTAVVMLVGAGVVAVEVDPTFDEIHIGTEEEAALDRIETVFDRDDDRGYAQLVVETDGVLDREALLRSLAFQQELRKHEAIEPTLAGEHPTVGVANLIALAAMDADDPSTVSLSSKRATIESMTQAEIDTVVKEMLAGEQTDEVWRLLPRSAADPWSATSSLIVVIQEVDPELSSGAASDEIVESQLAMQDLGAAMPDTVHVAGNGLLTHELNQSTGDTLALLGPLALAVVLLVLSLAYRQLSDIVFSLVGIGLVLLWTLGALGWLGIAFNPVLIAIPVFLIGLSIDFGLHVFMRYREHRQMDAGDRGHAMASALAGVGVALMWITVTTVTGFLSNVVSPMQPIRELGLMAAIGIVGAFVVFTGLLPPVKVELADRLDRVGTVTPTRPVGTNDGLSGQALASTTAVAIRGPVVILVLALVLTSAAGVVAIGVDTGFDFEDNVADDAPSWAEGLPEPLSPGAYTVRDTLEVIDEEYLREDHQMELLIEGEVTDPAVLVALDDARMIAAGAESTVRLGTGEPVGHDPITLMEELAEDDQAFRELVETADTTGDGLPDQRIAEVYDAMATLAPERTAAVMSDWHGGDGTLRASYVVSGSVDGATIVEDGDAIAEPFESAPVTAIATGEPITHHLIDQELIRTILVSLAITLGVVGVLLLGVFRLRYGSATLGLVTLLPVTMAVAWIIATVDLFGFSLDIVTALTASLTIGIGIDYSIHVTERFRAELVRSDTVHAAMETTIRGTGGALLASATTTAVGFGVLAFAVNPMLQQFGIITAVMIGYAFVGAVFVLPAFLMLWARYGCPAGQDLACDTGAPAQVPSD